MIANCRPTSLVFLIASFNLLTGATSKGLAQEAIRPIPGGQIIPALPFSPNDTSAEIVGTAESSLPAANSLIEGAASSGQGQSVQKPVVPASAEKPIPGMTYVALSPALKAIAEGREPTSLEELKALEQQQSDVARMIKRVTVNIQQGTAQGSGVFINEQGFILTAAHVAGSPGREATVIMHDGTRLRAKTLGMNRNHDAGLVRIENASRSYPHATVGQSKDLKTGQWVIGAGHPGGWQANRGAVIRVGRLQKMMPRNKEAHTLFTDCALIGGDSGGPLFTLDGKLIGIHSRIGTDVTDNMHVPIDIFRDNWDRMASKQEAWGVLPGFGPPYIGVTGKSDGPPVISQVESSGPAALAGMESGDLILSVDSKNISTFQELIDAIQASAPGEVVMIVVQRGEQRLRLPVHVGTQKQKSRS